MGRLRSGRGAHMRIGSRGATVSDSGTATDCVAHSTRKRAGEAEIRRILPHRCPPRGNCASPNVEDAAWRLGPARGALGKSKWER